MASADGQPLPLSLIVQRKKKMDDTFKSLTHGLHEKYQRLISMQPFTIDTTPEDCPVGGVYLFTKNGKHLYAGRTKRKIKTRLKAHVNTGNDCPFAYRLAKEAMGVKDATYKKEGSRRDLLTQPQFKQAYESAKGRIREMEVRFVGEPDPLKQALLEIYDAVVSKAKYNHFDTT